MNRLIKILILYFFIFWMFIANALANSTYYLCGPDEDGCFSDQTQYCACIPHDDIHAGESYCLDFNTLECYPLSEMPNCSPYSIFKDQSRCIATIFESRPEPPCPKVTKAYCEEHNIYICDVKGNPESCKRPHDDRLRA